MSNTGTFQATLGGVPLNVQYSIDGKKKCTTTFSYLGKLITFKLTKWSFNGWFTFVKMFYDSHTTQQDISAFGSYTLDPTNGLPIFNTSPQQINDIIIESSKDVFKFVDILLQQHQKQILDYCVWYRDRNSNPASYEEYIQLVSCHCVVRSEFLAGNVQWNIVPFIR